LTRPSYSTSKSVGFAPRVADNIRHRNSRVETRIATGDLAALTTSRLQRQNVAAVIGWDNANWVVALNVENITNERYFVAADGSVGKRLAAWSPFGIANDAVRSRSILLKWQPGTRYSGVPR
jgi:outer membrane receptor protein involved in Fe transport